MILDILQCREHNSKQRIISLKNLNSTEFLATLERGITTYPTDTKQDSKKMLSTHLSPKLCHIK